MKKFSFILGLGLAMVATASLAQQAQHHPKPTPYTPIGENTATINQDGWWHIGVIYQKGDNNTATINQVYGDGKYSLMNTAVISQVGFGNTGTITQWNMGNYAYLVQGTEYHHVTGAVGTITQPGFFNVAAIKQYSNSVVNVTQSGNFNAVLGLPEGGVNFCHPGHPAPYIYSCMPYHQYTPLLVGEGETYDIEQTGQGNYFYGIGILKGERTIVQTGDWDGGYPHHVKNDKFNRANNYIFLRQEGGNATLTQNGRENKIWLDMEVVGNGYPNVTITQNGYKNLVARFNSPCGDCGAAVGPAIFMGDNMEVTQTGWGNKLSVDSQSINSNIYVTQTGVMNSALIVQRDFAAVPANGGGGCHGCH